VVGVIDAIYVHMLCWWVVIVTRVSLLGRVSVVVVEVMWRR
jgi:hypothetical protein